MFYLFICLFLKAVQFKASVLLSTSVLLLIYFCVFSLSYLFCIFVPPMGHTDPINFDIFVSEDTDGAQNYWLGRCPHDTFTRGIRAMTQSLGDLTADLQSV